MKEILGNNLERFFNIVDNPPSDAEITFAGKKYEVWEVSDELYEKMCDMSEEEFADLAGKDAWWRSSEGSVLGIPAIEFEVNGEYLLGWDSPIYESKKGHKYKDLSEYLCDCIGASLPRNVCAVAMDLAKYNNMSMGELFETYEGNKDINHVYKDDELTMRLLNEHQDNLFATEFVSDEEAETLYHTILNWKYEANMYNMYREVYND